MCSSDLGRVREPLPFVLVADGRLDQARRVTPQPDGRWRADWPAGDWTDPEVPHRLVAWREADGARSAPQTLRLARPWTPAAEHLDPADDDHGPSGQYRYPQDPGYTGRHWGDLRAVRAWHAGGALALEVSLAEISRSWNPPNGFDHLALTLFIELPDTPGGVRAMPGQDADLPEGMRWHRRLRLHGWSNALFSAEGASATQEGTPIQAAARLRSDPATGRLRIELGADALGRPASLSGARLYLSTWDYDGGFRPLSPEGGPWAFGGAPGGAPRTMDDTPVLRLR